MPRIHSLDPIVINKIAAGEVIERPASVVKELLENCIDALATRVTVDVQQGGAELIRIVDDGEGIHPDDLLLAVTSHATSKITSDDDLFHVSSMGFRGEALASIASVAHVRIRSRIPDAEQGAELEVRGGHAQPQQNCGCPFGTSIEVRQLFGNTPVRRKFLKTQGTEFGHISEQFTRIALANPRLHMVLRHNEKTIFELPATHKLLDRLTLFYGSKLTEQLIWIEQEINGVRLWGYVAHPSQTKSTRKSQYLFLNGRWIQDRSLQHALSEGYRGLVMVGRHPIAFLFLEMPPDKVDVNVHPCKAEVRFLENQEHYRLLLSTLRSTFLSMDLDGTMSLEKKSDDPATVPQTTPEHQQNLQKELVNWAKHELENFKPTETISPSTSHTPTSFETSATTVMESPGSIPTPPPSVAAQHSNGESSTSPETQLPPAQEGTPVAPSTLAASTRVLQVQDCYLVTETDDGLMVIDQHALHERILYEQLRQRVLDSSMESQKMLVPEPIELSAREVSLLLEHAELFADLGFGLEEFGGNTILLNAYPVMLRRANFVQLIRDIAEKLDQEEKKPNPRDLLDSLLHMMSCKAAIKAGQRLTPEEIESLLALRHLVDDAHHCPHGRPTALVLSRDELDRQFGRLG